jgi:dTDP-4-amino-4,6-dideoxygalactose transaminase
MQIPLFSLKVHHEPLRAEFNAAIQEVIDTNAFAGGPFVEKFEKEFAVFCECRHAIGVGSGTDALWLALLALGIGPGDEVITVPFTFMATAEAITYTGAKPVFVDIDERTYAMDAAHLSRAITSQTKAIIPVHLYGQCADMDSILEIAKARNIPVIEDACQAHGATYKGRKAGSLGIAGCFSFYPGKNLGAFGEAGAITTNDPNLASKLRMFRDHGQSQKYLHDVIGWNARMDGIQGAVLSVKLKHLADNNEKRRDHARAYTQKLSALGFKPTVLRLPYEAPDRTHVYHLYVVRVPDRKRFMSDLASAGIGCAMHYPTPIHLQRAYAGLNLVAGSFPVAERCAAEIVSLPMYPELSSEQVSYVVQQIRTCIRP